MKSIFKTEPGTSASVTPTLIYLNKIIISSVLSEHARAASLDGLHLGLSPGETAEAGGQLRTIEELAGLGLNGAQGRARVAANGAVEGGATEGTVLLGLGAVGGERVGESTSGGSRVDARSVVNGPCCGLAIGKQDFAGGQSLRDCTY